MKKIKINALDTKVMTFINLGVPFAVSLLILLIMNIYSFLSLHPFVHFTIVFGLFMIIKYDEKFFIKINVNFDRKIALYFIDYFKLNQPEDVNFNKKMTSIMLVISSIALALVFILASVSLFLTANSSNSIDFIRSYSLDFIMVCIYLLHYSCLKLNQIYACIENMLSSNY